MNTFRLREHGRAYLPIYIKRSIDQTMMPVRFKVDTGADVTTISKVTLRNLGFTKEWIEAHIVKRTQIITATGDVIESAIIQIPVLNLLGYEAKNWTFSILLEEKRDLKNLIGRDLLSGFNYKIDNDRDLIEIERTK